MSKKILKYKIERIATWPFSFVAIAMMVMGLFLLLSLWLLGIGLILLGAAIISADHGLEFNPDQKKYRQYHSVLLIPFGGWKAYDIIDKIFINSVTVSQIMYSRSNRASTFKHTEYQGFLKFVNGEKIVLRSEKNKKRLLPHIKKMAIELNVNLKDNTKE